MAKISLAGPPKIWRYAIETELGKLLVTTRGALDDSYLLMNFDEKQCRNDQTFSLADLEDSPVKHSRSRCGKWA
jgi:hypothetical protein